MSVQAPIILGDNILEDASTVTVTTEEAGFPIENVFDYRIHNLWKPGVVTTQNIDADYGSAKEADAIAIIGHNLFSAGASNIIVQHDNNSGFTSPTQVLNVNPSSDDPIYYDMTSGTERYWRIKISGHTTALFIGHISVGKKITMPRGPANFHNPDGMQGIGKAFNSQKGQFLGASLRFVERQVIASFELMDFTFVNDTLLPFLQGHYIRLKPFFYIPDLTTYPDRVYFLRAPDNPGIDLPWISLYRSWALEAIGVKQSDFGVI